MSPSRATDTCTCWKSCHSCDSLRIGCTTWPAIMLKAMSSPTVIEPAITDCAPMNRISAVVILLTYWILFWPTAPVTPASKDLLTYEASRSSHCACIIGSTLAAFSVGAPTIDSTKNCCERAPRLNRSLICSRRIGRSKVAIST